MQRRALTSSTAKTHAFRSEVILPALEEAEELQRLEATSDRCVQANTRATAEALSFKVSSPTTRTVPHDFRKCPTEGCLVTEPSFVSDLDQWLI
jgi:hypothetical protein